MFAEEKPLLLAVPIEPFRYYQYEERVVHLDGCVEVEAAYYGLPPGWIGRSVKVQWDALHVRILHPGTNQLLREHLRQKRGWYRINAEDYPKKMPLSTAQLLRRAGHAGNQIGARCGHLSATRRGGYSPHPGCPLPGQEIWHGGGGRCLRRGPGNRCA